MSEYLHSTYVVIPTLNAAKCFEQLLPALAQQGINRNKILFIDSTSIDNTSELARDFGARVEEIPRGEFNHGTTRTLAAHMLANAEFIIYLTQDAIPATAETFVNILSMFDDERIGMAYGRQLPHKHARGIEAHARLFNYSDDSAIRTLEDKEKLGIKTIFCSNSFAAYRYSALRSVGFFPSPSFFAEDQIVAARMLLAGKAMAYAADAKVYHSHGFTVTQDLKRYFDVGVFHARNKWILNMLGQAEGEGKRFVLSELAYLVKHEPQSLPSAVLRSVAKYAGYKLGQREGNLSNRLKTRLSAQPSYWKNL